MFCENGTVALSKSLQLKVQASVNMRQEMAATRLNGLCLPTQSVSGSLQSYKEWVFVRGGEGCC